jgi:hypothetical protein
MATKKTVTIKIDRADLETLTNGNYCMCFAKKVSDDFNVVWQSYTDYQATNSFSWIPAYQMFGTTNQFSAGVRVSIQTEIVDVGLGEMLTLDASGSLRPAVPGGDPKGITLVNNYGSIHPGLSDGQRYATPIYVAKYLIGKGINTLYPTEIVRVWFAQNAVTATMIGEPPSNFVDIDMTWTDTAACLYKGQTWTPVT